MVRLELVAHESYDSVTVGAELILERGQTIHSVILAGESSNEKELDVESSSFGCYFRFALRKPFSQ